MNLKNVRLILRREVRDQLRDRRTLFMIAVLPLLLYPLMGMSLLQVAQFVREQPTRLLLAGTAALPASPALLAPGDAGDATSAARRSILPEWFAEPDRARLIEVQVLETPITAEEARARVVAGDFEAVVVVPDDFAAQLASFRGALQSRSASGPSGDTPAESQVPSPAVYFNTAKEKSQLASLRITQVLSRWTAEIGRQNLVDSHVSPSAVKPFDVAEHDLADSAERQAVVWSKVLPFLLVIWALTGAFYPAVDLCAGEKERGTLETLLISPAERSEIVVGKLLTVMLFSSATAILNVLSLGLTGAAVVEQFPELGPPPALAPLWLGLAVVPLSALFSALCLALAALARSTKEGQYYLMPLLMGSLPLMMLPMAPGVELNLGNSLIPITGVVLVLRGLLEGEFAQTLPFLLPVTLVTAVCCWLAVRWAVDQFNSETVLFRDSEEFDLRLWLRQLWRDRQPTPTPALALGCASLILLANFFLSMILGRTALVASPLSLAVATQLGAILLPALALTMLLTTSPRQTLLLQRTRPATLAAAALLAVVIHPLAMCGNVLVQRLYPVSEPLGRALNEILRDPPSTWQLLLVLAVLPALCEELAFRGFILSGLRHLGRKWQAIVVSSVCFGVAHGVLQQSILASIVGVVIGYLAVQTGSLWPGVVYHMTHNALGLLASRWVTLRADHDELAWLIRDPAAEGASLFTWPVVALAGLMTVVLLGWFRRLPYRATTEESLRSTMEALTRPEITTPVAASPAT